MFGKTPRGATARPDPHTAPRSVPAIPHWLWLIFVVLFGLSLAALLYLWQPWQPAKRLDVPSTEVVEADDAPKTDSKGDYEFYELLPRQQVTPVPQQEVPVPARTPAAAHPEPLPAEVPLVPGGISAAEPTATAHDPAAARQAMYILQVNSYDNPDDADRQRAEVLLTGLSADIRQTTVDQVVWYRVVSGPYASKAEAEAAQNTLQNSGIDALVVEQP